LNLYSASENLFSPLFFLWFRKLINWWFTELVIFRSISTKAGGVVSLRRRTMLSFTSTNARVLWSRSLCGTTSSQWPYEIWSSTSPTATSFFRSKSSTTCFMSTKAKKKKKKKKKKKNTKSEHFFPFLFK